MKIIDLDKGEFPKEDLAIALGNFDGIHKGHLTLLNEVIYNQNKLVPSVLIFKEHTQKLLKKKEITYLTSLSDKLKILEDLGIELVILCTFDEDIAHMKADKFLTDFLYDKLRVRQIVVGRDYRFGSKASGNIKTIEDVLGDRVCLIVKEDVLYEGKEISSTWIRKEVEKSNFSLVRKLMTRDFKIEGRVVHGYQRGSKMGFPTANIEISFPYVRPKNGVYFTRVKISNRWYFAATSLGANPTFEYDGIKLESYVLDFNQDIYDKNIQIEFIEFLRDEIKFNSKDDLIKQISQDEKKCRKLISIYKNKDLW